MKKRKILSFLIAALIVLSTFTAAGLTAEAKDAFGGVADFFGGAFADLREKLTAANDYPDPVPKTQIGDSSTYWEYADGVLTISGEGAMPDYVSLWYNIADSIESVVICDGVTSVGVFAFAHCTSLESVTFPEGLTTIGDNAFTGTSLESVTFPEGLTTIGDYAFCECTSLASVTLPEGLTTIGESAFRDCDSLESVTFPEGLKEIGDSAFAWCESLLSITVLAETPPSLGMCSFGISLRIYVLEEKVETYKSAWSDYASQIFIIGTPEPQGDGEQIPGSFTFWELENGVLTISGEGKMPEFLRYDDYPWYDIRDSITSVVICDGVTFAGNYAFRSCTSLTSVTFPEGLTTIGEDAFAWCTSLTSVTFPEGLTIIGGWAFSNCTSLASVTFPESLTTIGMYAFSNCASPFNIFCLPKNPPEYDYFSFYGCDDLKFYVPAESVEAYKEAWSEYADQIYPIFTPEPIEKTQIGDSDHYWEYADGVLTISGEGAIPDFVVIPRPWYDITDYITSVVISEGVTAVGSYAFRFCESLTSVTLPKGLTTIEDDAFSKCGSLSSVEFSEGLKSIGRFAFCDCGLLASVTLPDGLTEIGDYAFDGCTSLTSITFPEGLTTIGGGAFHRCSSLASVTCLAKEPPEMFLSAFDGCSPNLKIYVPAESVEAYKEAWSEYADQIYPIFTPEPVEKTQIGDSSTYWEYADGVLTISGEGATPDFAAPNANLLLAANAIPQPWADLANNITEIVIENGVTKLGENAFAGLSLVCTVTVGSETPPTLPGNAFADCSDNLEIHVPETAGEAYKEAWEDYAEQIVADEEPPAPQYEKGDVNGDSDVTITDYLMIKAQVLGTKEFDAEIYARMDVNEDGDVNITDYLLVKKIVLEK